MDLDSNLARGLVFMRVIVNETFLQNKKNESNQSLCNIQGDLRVETDQP